MDYVGHAQKFASNGSPALLGMVGRAFGLAEAEQKALFKGGIPWWFWLTAGVAVGVVGGIQVHRRWPEKVPGFLR